MAKNNIQTFTNSPLVGLNYLSPYYEPRKKKIKKITIHHMAGVFSAWTCGDIFNRGRVVSANYGIGYDGEIGLYVKEKNRAYTSCSYSNDQQAVTIEVSNSKAADPWPVSDKVYGRLIELCVDICRRNGIKKLIYTGDERGNLTQHNFFWATACPGPYLEKRMPDIAKKVNEELSKEASKPKPTPKPDKKPADSPASNKGDVIYRVQVGAFKSKTRAQEHERRLKELGYSVYIRYENGYYKAQIGAFRKRENAEALAKEAKGKFNKKYGGDGNGLDYFITKIGADADTKGAKVPPPQKIERGDTIRIKPGARDLNTGGKFADFVYRKNHKAMLVLDGSVSFGNGKQYTGKVKKSDVVKV